MHHSLYRPLFATLVCLLSLLPAQAGLEEGADAYERKDYTTVPKALKMLAEQGDAGAQFNLGLRYAKGQGVPQNRVVAYALYNLSAANDPSDENNAPKNRDALLAAMTPDAVAAAQALSLEMSKPGNFLKALDAATR